MSKELYFLTIAYAYIVNDGHLTDKMIKILADNKIDSIKFQDYVNVISNYRRSLTIEQQNILENNFGLNLSLIDQKISNSNNTDLNNNTNSNINTKAKVHTLTNGKKQFGDYDEAAFSDIYMFGFLVLLFQVLFLIISYILFTK